MHLRILRMSVRLSAFRGTRRILATQSCFFCHPSLLSVRNYTINRRLDPKKGTPREVRAEIDERNRKAYYRMLQPDRLLPCKLDDANKIINLFVSNRASNMDPATNVRKVAERFKLKVVHLPMLAIPMFRIPDVNDEHGQLPPSQQSPVAASILLACSAAGDLQATLQILHAVYYASNAYKMPKAIEIARLYTPKELSDCKEMLKKLADGETTKGGAAGDASAMTLHGKFLEMEGNKAEACYYYEKALGCYNTKIFRGYPHPMAFPWLTPWMELANLEAASQTPSVERMTQALEFGALKADDPMAFYKLALLQETRNPEWLKYMSKAAASGHNEAMYSLGQFYHEMNAQPASLWETTNFRKALRFITSWRKSAVADFGMEWFNAAALGGHKPAMMEMAQLYEQSNAQEKAKEWLRAAIKEPPNDLPEQWPQLVLQAKHRLAALNTVHQGQEQLA